MARNINQYLSLLEQQKMQQEARNNSSQPVVQPVVQQPIATVQQPQQPVQTPTQSEVMTNFNGAQPLPGWNKYRQPVTQQQQPVQQVAQPAKQNTPAVTTQATQQTVQQPTDKLARTTDDPHSPTYWNGNNAFNQKAREIAYGIDPSTGQAVTDEKAAHLGGMATNVNIDKNGNTPGSKSWRDSITNTKQEEQEDKENRRRLAVLAIGDAIRHMGNLYYTTKGATPQQFNSPEMEEYNRQQTQKKEKQAAELARQQQEAKQRQQDYENALKSKADARADIKLGFDKDANDRANKKSEDDAKKAALQLDELNAKIAGAKSDAAKKKYQAEKERVVASLQGKLMKSQIDAHEASASASRASATNSRKSAYLNDLKAADLRDSRVRHFGHADESKMWAIPKNEVSAVEKRLTSIAREKWAKERKDMTGKVTPYTDKELLNIALAHESEPEIQKLYSKYGKEVKSNLDSSAGFSLK